MNFDQFQKKIKGYRLVAQHEDPDLVNDFLLNWGVRHRKILLNKI